MNVVRINSSPRAPKYHGQYVVTRPNDMQRGTLRHAMIKAAVSHRSVASADRAFGATHQGRALDWSWLTKNGYVAFLDR